MIKGSESLFELAEISPSAVQKLKNSGFGSYFETRNLNKIGKYVRLRTLLDSKGVDSDSFIKELNQTEEQKSDPGNKLLHENKPQLHLNAMLPCGLRNPFKEFFENYLLENKEIFKGLNYLVEGNVNHELSYYPLLDNIKDEEELPDIIIASDVNNFFHKPFKEKFINKGYFKAILPESPNPFLDSVGYFDHKKYFTMFTANMLVMAVDLRKLGDRSIPVKWNDLLADEFENSIIMRGEDDFFCNAVMLPFFKDDGFDSIKILAKNIKSGKHPAEMVKLAESEREEGAAVYILPYFFAKKIKSRNVKVVWPEDGAIASPVFMLIKETKVKKHEKLLSFLMSTDTGNMLVDRFFPSISSDSDNSGFPGRAKWLGWDFLEKYDIGALKDNIRDVFMEVWNEK